MPIYLRKNAPMSIPSATTHERGIDDDDDFILDPELFRDSLPQPFRMVDKIIDQIIDRAHDIILNRENERYKEATKLRPPQYKCGVNLEEYSSSKCMTSTPDGQFVVMGYTSGLLVVDANKYGCIAEWKESAEITAVNSRCLAENIYLISAIDDFGTARLFALSGSEIYLLHTFAENSQEKVIAAKCEASTEGDFIGVYFKSSSTSDSWLEIFKSPKEVWLKEISSRTPAKKPAVQDNEEDFDSLQQTVPDSDKLSVASQSQSPADSQREASPPPSKTSFKFTSPTATLRVRMPQPIKGVTWSSPYQLSKTIEGTGEVLGSGSHHQMSVQHLHSRTANFERINKSLQPYLPGETIEPSMEPSFHFLPSGRLIHNSTEAAGSPVSVCVWWSTCSQLMHYSLTKNAKELEYKPDMTWPLSGEIMTSCLSPDSSLLALGLRNNNIVIWDVYLGNPRRIVHISENSYIKSLLFLNPSLYPTTQPHRPYKMTSHSYLLAVQENGQVFLIDTTLGSDETPKSFSLSIDKSTPSFVSLIEGFPQLMLSCWNDGKVYLHDIMSGDPLCEIVMPSTHSLATPWQPVVTCALLGQMLFMKGNEIAEVIKKEEGEKCEESCCLFVFQLRSFPSLDKYHSHNLDADKPVHTVHTMLSKRIEALMSHRLALQNDRPGKMQKRWGELQHELQAIRQLKQARDRSVSIQALLPLDKTSLDRNQRRGHGLLLLELFVDHLVDLCLFNALALFFKRNL